MTLKPTCIWSCRCVHAVIALIALPIVTYADKRVDTFDQVNRQTPRLVSSFLENHCVGCHDGDSAEGNLDLSLLSFDLTDRQIYDRWELIHDRVRDGEMPPPDDGIATPVAEKGWSSAAAFSDAPSPDRAITKTNLSETHSMLRSLASALIETDQQRIGIAGRSKVRRLNRHEYENSLRQLLDAPWLQIADALPEDGVEHLFNKVGERLDVSHVQVMRYLDVGERAIRLAVDAAGYPCNTEKYYARDEPTMHNYLHYRFGQTAATRSIVPLDGLTPEPEIIRKKQPLTVGDADPEKRQREAMGVFSGVYSATTKYDFSRVHAPIDGHYRLRFKTYSFTAGPHGASGGNDHGLTGGNRAWWRPDRNVAFRAQRSEPITLYALAESGDSRWLTTFDSQPDPTVWECLVSLKKGEGIRPDAARLVRTRPGWSGNPNATESGVPGFAMCWLEVEGPLHPSWPPKSYQAVFGEMPFELSPDGSVRVVTENPQGDARQLIERFYRRAIGPERTDISELESFVRLFDTATQLGQEFTDAIISVAVAVLSSPRFLYLDSQPGRLPSDALHKRLAYFLWNGPADAAPLSLSDSSPVGPSDDDLSDDDLSDEDLDQTVDRMLADPRSKQFIAAFLDYWLDLRDINANTPDAELYPDYYLDELLTESSLLETRAFFKELVDKDLPVRNLVDSDFVFINERLAEHYRLPSFEGVRVRRVDLPQDSHRGGLLTQASLLRVTANGTTTSPVIRGAWIAERILGIEIPAPPSGVPAVEPDIRGAKTVREQLAKHREVDACNACHVRFDPFGFALESFDVAGGWRDRYRAVGGKGQAVEGFGKNGHAFRFKVAQSVDCSGELATGETFQDIEQLKRLLLADERQLARNLVNRLIVYATGAAVSFADRSEVEAILDRSASSQFGVRTLIQEVVNSDLFKIK